MNRTFPRWLGKRAVAARRRLPDYSDAVSRRSQPRKQKCASGCQSGTHRNARKLAATRIEHPDDEAGECVAICRELRGNPCGFRTGCNPAAAGLPFRVVEAGRAVGNFKEV